MIESVARRLFQLVEPVALVTYMADEPTQAVMALGLRNMWGAYFAGRAAPLGREAPRPPTQHANRALSPHCGGLVGADGWLTAAGRQTKERVETLTDELAAPAYDMLEPGELDQLVEDLEPLAPVLLAAGSQ